MKECDKRKSHISSNHILVCLTRDQT